MRDIRDNATWFNLPSDKCIQGMLVNDEGCIIVYIVTLTPVSKIIYSY